MMHKRLYSMLKLLIVALCSVSIMGCVDKDEDVTDLPLNSFSMRLNDKAWKPYGSDLCSATYNCVWSSIDDKPFYTITAYYDPKGVASYRSENQFRIQIMDVTEPGVYTTTGSYKQDFESYALFVDKIEGEENGRRYVNSPVNSFFVEVEDIFPVEGFSTKGIEGTFYGTLYNEDDPQDFVTIEKGAFTFQLLNYSGGHCR